MATTNHEPLLVIYDGDCGVCSATIQWLRERDRHGSLEFQSNEAPLPEGVSREETEQTVVVLDRTQHLHLTRGAAASRVLRELPHWALLGRLMNLPGLSWVVDRFYVRFARNRHRISRALGMNACSLPSRR